MMQQNQQPKSVRTDKRTGERRLRFVSNRERSARATADVYRSKDKIISVIGSKGTTSSSSSVIVSSSSTAAIATTSQFAVELDLALDRNTCEVFQTIYNRLFPLSRSLPEILHHLPQLLDILLLRNRGGGTDDDKDTDMLQLSGFILALPDTLHLIAILAKETRDELHPLVHTKIFPRLLQLLTDATYSTIILQHIPIVEAIFCTISNILRYDTLLVTDEEAPSKQKKKTSSTVSSIRKYYGPTLGHKSPLIRRLAGQTFGLFLRKFHAIQRHIQQILRAYIASLSQPSMCLTTRTSATAIAASAITNTMDGISWMFYFAAKGVPGQLHSKGLHLLQIILKQYETNTTATMGAKDVNNVLEEEESRDSRESNAISTLVAPLISNLFLKICNHMNPSYFTPIWDILFRTLQHILQEQTHQQRKKQLALKCVLDLIESCASFHENHFLSALPTASSSSNFEAAIVTTMEAIFIIAPSPQSTSTASRNNYNLDVKESMLRLVCTFWKARPNSLLLKNRIPPLLLQLLHSNEICKTASHNHPDNNSHSILFFLAQHLLPHLPVDVSLTTLIPTILQASLFVEKSSQANSSLISLVLLHAVATNLKNNSLEGTEEAIDEHREQDTLFNINSKSNFVLSSVDYNSLWNLILYHVRGAKKSEDNVERIIYVLRCIPLLLNGNGDDDHHKMWQQHNATKILLWLSSTLTFLDECLGEQQGKNISYRTTLLVVAKSLLLELTSCVVSISKEDKAITSILEEMYTSAQKFLKDYPSSVWTVRGVSYFLKAITACTRLLQLHHKNNDMVHVDEIFDLLVPNLRQTNHYLRLYTLSILVTLPTKSYVVDHADIDFTQDLDEEPSNANTSNANTRFSSVFCGTCDLMSILYQIEKLPLHIDQERKLTSFISRVEVLGRSGKLPVVYAEAAGNHMLGILSLKFSPIWPAATKAFAGLVLSSTSTSLVEQLLNALISKIESVSSLLPTLASKNVMSDMPCPLHNFEYFCTSSIHHQARLCTHWEDSNGTNIDLFRYDRKHPGTENQVLMPKSRCTDESTLFQLVMGALEAIPDVAAKNSRRLVPLFIGFLHYEYFAAPSSPVEDARELSLSYHTEAYSLILQHCSQGKKALKKKLVSFLKVFAAISGPQQLYKNKLLSGIFFSLLSSPDPIISQLALESLSKYKFVYLLPYMEHLRKLLTKGEMKSVLLGLDLSKESGILPTQHRKQFIPLLSRLLFGRLMAKGGGKCTKDTPKIRRRAVLSFFSKLASNEGELDYFIYLMVRAFIPSQCSIKLDYQESGLDSSLCKVKELTMLAQTVTMEDVAKIRYQKQVGFLNLISDAISYLGYGIHFYTDIFLPILLTLCEHSALHPAGNLSGSVDVAQADQDECSMASEEKEAASINDEIDTPDIMDASTDAFHFSTIRSLCFQGLSQLFLQFSPSVNFIKYSERMWAAFGAAIENLPRSVVNAPHCPSLLRLLNVLSSDSNLIPLLAANPLAVEAAFKCIDVTSQLAVMEVSMGIVENLLNEGQILDSSISSNKNASRLGRDIVTDHLHLLITQLSSRVCSRCTKQGSMGSLAKKELSILCQASDLIDLSSLASIETAEDTGIKQDTLNVLCSSLVSFLAVDRHEKEEIRVHILHIVNNFLPNLSAETAMKLFVPLSKLLGPSKSYAGVLSPEIRALIIEALGKVSIFVGSNLHDVVSALQRLHTYDSRHVGEFNFEIVLPTLNKLGEHSHALGTWESFVPKNEDDEYGAKIIIPLLFHCLHTLYSNDGVLSRGAFKALKTFVLIASQNDTSADSTAYERVNQSFSRVLETSMMPIVRQGLHSKNDAIHRYFVQMLREVCRNFKASTTSSFYGDLNILVREDDAELDFFLNTSHVQIHRRARALARLRKEFLGTSMPCCSFTQSSLSNILLPLALRPLCSDKPSEETYALEAVATVGAIARHLTWPKYDIAITDLLRQFPRFPHQERFFIGAICSILDSFHFDVNNADCPLTIDPIDDPSSDSRNEIDKNTLSGYGSNRLSSKTSNSSVWKALNQRIIPRTELLLMKTLTDKCGSRIQQLRSPVALALTKLFQKLPLEVLLDKVPRLVLEVCTALRSKDSDCRDIARETLARMAASLGEKYLSLMLNHLATTLTEGYQLHVRSAALHSILLSLSKVYTVPLTLVDKDFRSLPFDQCVPAIMDLIMQDLFGVASEMKDVEYVEKRLVKEAMGSKTMETLEIICKCISFRPSSSVGLSLPSLSSVHNIVIPLLDRLRSTDTNSSTIGKIKECLTRVVVGLSQNPTTTTNELMPFVHAVVAPFLVGDEQLPEYSDSAEEYSDDEDSDEASENPIVVSRSGGNVLQNKNMQRPKPVTQWHPSSVMAPINCRSARELSNMQKRDLQKVLDGDSAPKLTGKARHGYLEQLVESNLSDPSKVCGVLFGLSLLHSCLKKSKVDPKDPQALAMADPFVPMLAYCIMTCENNEVILLSLKLLGHFLYWDLPSLKRYQRKIASNVMKLLAQHGGVLSSNHEVTHGCFKALTLLFDKHVLNEGPSPQLLNPTEASKDSSMAQEIPCANRKRNSKDDNRLPLSHEQMKVLVSMLTLAATSTEHHNSTFSLIKAIVSRRFLSAEFYDLMEKLLELSVQSLKVGVRQHASNIFVKFLLTYPLDHKRLLQHLQQIVLNIKYEYEEGRMSGIKLLDTVIGKLPLPLLKKHGSIFFFPLILQLVNDESNSCREAVARVIRSLFQRSSMDQLQTYYDYMKQWFLDKKEGGAALRRTSAQLIGFFVEIRADYFVGRKNKLCIELVNMIQNGLRSELAVNRTRQAEQFVAISFATAEQWETAYFCLICFEKMLMQKTFFTKLSVDIDVWTLIIDCLIFPHPWVQQVSCRVIWLYLQGADTVALEDSMVTSSSSISTESSIQCPSLLVIEKGLLFDVAKNICVQLNFAEDQFNESHVVLSIKILTWISLRMSADPQLFYKEGEYVTTEKDKRQDPLLWLFTRLASISKGKGIMRRSAVFKCFASIVTTLSREDDEKKSSYNTITPYLEILLEALHRAVSEVEAAAANSVTRMRSSTSSSISSDFDLPKEVMNLLEEKCGTEAFLAAYSSVQRKAREKKLARKQQVFLEAVRNPKEAAKRKIRKQSKEKERKKRKIQERKASRGVFSKKLRI